MKRDALLLILMLLCVVSVPVDTEAPIIIDTFDSSKFVISQTEMPIYELITPEVNETHTELMARSLTPIPEISAEEVEGVWVVNYLNQTFEMDRRDGSMWYADYDKIWNVALGIEVPTPSDCRVDADDWLERNGLLPANAVFAGFGSTNVTAYNPDAGETRSKVLQWHVNYEFTVGEYPVTGEAAQISVMIGNNGDIVGFDWKWRATEPVAYATSSLIEYESVLEAYGIPTSEVVDHRLVYTTDEGDDNKLLYPVWELELLEEADDVIPLVVSLVHIDATLFDPQVEITTPSAAISVMPGQSVTFDCSVQFGTPPYTYEWGSDFDGVLSTAKTFSTMTLSKVTKKDTPIPHAVWIKVRDYEGRGASDVVAVTVEDVDFNPPPTLTITLVAVSGVAILAASLLVLRRKKGGFALLFLLMMFSAFMLFPVTFASGGVSDVRQFTPSAPTGAYDDGLKEVGIEWVGMSHHNKPLWNTETNIEGFYNWMGAYGGYSQEFNWGEYSAWEEDFKDAAFSGTDTEWVDAVDFVYYQDHGGPDGVSFTSNHDDKGLEYSALRLGDGDLDTIVFDACSPLAWENDNGDDVFQRWAPSLQGIHQVLSFGTTSQNSAVRGTKFALYMTGFSILQPTTIVNAWFRACAETEGSDRLAAVFYATKSPDPNNPQLDDPINDHAYGFGYVCSDPTPGSFSWYMYITSSC
ncbi:MAG: immunoglobulin domain-containing protein [Candidatus Thorarchaeota archaeon]|nr:immunoglobulin domain-containing protein [Candidatus Thorarchaeota archaeon]